jgi:predicted  nucleic acid-binding Zn-ribbon protein
VLAVLGSDALEAADAADAAVEEARAALAEPEAEAAEVEEAEGAASEAAVQAEEAVATAREELRAAERRANAAWSAIGMSTAGVLSALDAAAAARRRHLEAIVSKLQAWVRAWRKQRSTASVAMAGVVADTIAEFQKALDRELGILTHRAKLAVGRVEKKKGEQWFLEALNERLREMNGAGVAESIAASSSGSAMASAAAATMAEGARQTPKRRS